MMKYPFARVAAGARAGELCRYTIGVDSPSHMVDRLPWQKTGKSYTASGYGVAIPTVHKVRTVDDRWRRVYCTVYSNVGTLWIVERGVRVIVDLV